MPVAVECLILLAHGSIPASADSSVMQQIQIASCWYASIPSYRSIPTSSKHSTPAAAHRDVYSPEELLGGRTHAFMVGNMEASRIDYELVRAPCMPHSRNSSAHRTTAAGAEAASREDRSRGCTAASAELLLPAAPTAHSAVSHAFDRYPVKSMLPADWQVADAAAAAGSCQLNGIVGRQQCQKSASSAVCVHPTADV